MYPAMSTTKYFGYYNFCFLRNICRKNMFLTLTALRFQPFAVWLGLDFLRGTKKQVKS